MTRATRALFGGEWLNAYRYHPFVFVLVPTLTAWGVSGALRYVCLGVWQSKQATARTERVMGVIAVLMVLLWMARFCGACGGPLRDT